MMQAMNDDDDLCGGQRSTEVKYSMFLYGTKHVRRITDDSLIAHFIDS